MRSCNNSFPLTDNDNPTKVFPSIFFSMSDNYNNPDNKNSLF